MRHRALLALVWLGLAGCNRGPSVPDGAPAWQAALFTEDSIRVAWGYRKYSTDSPQTFFPLGPEVTLSPAQRTELRGLLTTAEVESRSMCLLHIDLRISAGKFDDQLCLGCGVFLAVRPGEGVGALPQEVEWSGSGANKDALRTLFERILGPRPKEPEDADGHARAY